MKFLEEAKSGRSVGFRVHESTRSGERRCGLRFGALYGILAFRVKGFFGVWG